MSDAAAADPMRTPTPEGVETVRSAHDVAGTLDRLAALATARGLTLFARIEFARDAAGVGLALRPMAQLVFGNPRAGTALLAAAPTAGLDLPLRALAWTDDAGQTWLSYTTPEALVARPGAPGALAAAL
ncbi:MAG TPA: DUF302 domain-containing protein, partial [Gemmatirosa sp.]